MVCAEIRRQYGTPVERLKWMQRFMLQKDANHFQAAIWMISTLGDGVWLCPDLEETSAMDCELEFVDLWQHRFFWADRERALESAQSA